MNGFFKEGESNNRTRLYIVLLLALFILLLNFQFIDDNFSNLRGGDNASYVLLAKSITMGSGYSDISLPGSPPHTQYPPGFPLLLARVFSLLGFNFMWMRLVVIFFALASLFLIGLTFYQRARTENERDGNGGASLALVITLLTATNFHFVFFTQEILPEIPYLFFSLLAFFVINSFSAAPESKEGAGAGRWLYPLLLIIPIAYFTKLIGVTLIAAGVCVLFVKFFTQDEGKGDYIKKLVWFGFIAVVPLLFWLARGSLLGDEGGTYQSIIMQADYYDQGVGKAGVAVLFERFLSNVALYSDVLPWVLINVFNLKAISPFFFRVLSLALLAVVLLGLIRELITKRTAVSFYFLAYIGLLSVWPVYGAGDARRYMVPLVPFLYYFFFTGIFFISKVEVGERGKRLSVILTAATLVFVLLNCSILKSNLYPPSAAFRIGSSFNTLAENFSKRFENAPLEKVTNSFFETSVPCYHRYLTYANLLGSITGPEALIMTRKPEIVSLVSGRRAVRFPFMTDQAKMLDFVEKSNVTHLLLDSCYPETKKYLIPFAKENISMLGRWRAGEVETDIFKVTAR